MFSLRFWGVRGSIPCPGKNTVKYGGNTSCLEIRADKRLIIVDLGTGVKSLGDFLLEEASEKEPLDMDIFISHTHWDHIMGFPMFSPVFVSGAKMRIWGPMSYDDESLASVINNQLSHKYWPVRLSELTAQIEFRELSETSIDLGGGLKLTTKYLNHPILCLGYRFEYEGKAIVTAYDHEPFRNLFNDDPESSGYSEEAARKGKAAAAEENEKIMKFFGGADILVHDTMYTEEEYEDHLGWGHSSYEIAVDAASKSGVKKLVLFHHDPSHSDSMLKGIEKKYNARKKSGAMKKIITAREGLTIEA